MADTVDKATRSRMMSTIRSKNTQPELRVRKYLHAQGMRFRVHDRNLPGRPDIVLPRYKTVVFVQGCFWHRHRGCELAYNPKSRHKFWQKKFSENVERDRRARRALRRSGWRGLTIWECALRAPTADRSLAKLCSKITGA
jgi:DNA mismatch endonuclease (patch repair protein)